MLGLVQNYSYSIEVDCEDFMCISVYTYLYIYVYIYNSNFDKPEIDDSGCLWTNAHRSRFDTSWWFPREDCGIVGTLGTVLVIESSRSFKLKSPLTMSISKRLATSFQFSRANLWMSSCDDCCKPKTYDLPRSSTFLERASIWFSWVWSQA